jgi:carbon-monoxide dehydrogenase large subunit
VTNHNGNHYVGRPHPRTEDPRLLTGNGCFLDDLHRPGMLHAVVVRSQVAHGVLRGIDPSAALALPGVHAVFSAVDIDGEVPRIPVRIAPLTGTAPYCQPVIAYQKIRYVGEPVAIVVADSQALAEDALGLVNVDIDPCTPVATTVDGEKDATLLFEEPGTNIASKYHIGRGDIEAAFAQAPYVRRERFSVQRHTAMPMEMRGLLAEWDDEQGHMTVWGAAKVPFATRRTLAEMLSLPNESVDLIELDVGGGFGVRGEFYPEDFLVPFASRRLNRPVKWQEDRREHMMSTVHSRESRCDLEIACSSTGLIMGLRARVTADIGAYMSTTGGILASRTGQFLPGPYRIPHVGLQILSVVTNKTPAGSYRGPGRFESSFFRERLFDMAARELNIDPVEFRRRNLLASDELPYSIGQLVPYEVETSYDCGDYPAVLARCAREIGWETKSSLRGQLVDGRYHGLGVGCFVDSSGAGPKENARIRLEADGRVSVFVGSSALGQGIETAFAQICADALQITMDRISIFHGSTTLLAEGFGSFHSRSMIMGGNAILDAANNLIDALRQLAAERWGCAPETVAYTDGCLRSQDQRAVEFSDLAACGRTIEAPGTFGTKAKPFSYGSHAAHVAVDVGTGHVELIDYVAVEDVGRMINPMIVHGQKIGSIVQGLGGVFLEHLEYDEQGQLLTGSLADYLMPTSTDFPNIRAIALDLTRTARNPLGVKGAGEDGISPVAGVLGNAIADALSSFGVEPRQLPITPPALWRLVEDSKADQSAEAVTENDTSVRARRETSLSCASLSG